MDITENTENIEVEQDPIITQFHVEVVDKALEEGVRIPRSQIEFMEKGLTEKKIPLEYMSRKVDRVIEKHKETGLEWKDVENPRPGKATAKYCSEKEGVRAYILPFQKKDDPDVTLYKANLIDKSAPEGEQHKTVKVSKFPDSLKSYVEAIHTQKLIVEVNNEMRQEKDLKPEKTPEKAPEMEMSI